MDTAVAAAKRSSAASSATPRLPAIDLLRGLAIVAMAIYHFAWDLALFGFVGPQVPFEQPFLGLARATAASFLFLVGVSLVLANRDGVRWSSFLRRFLVVAGAAGLVTLGTRIATPDSFVRFGILHLIAAVSVVGLPFVRLSPIVTALAGVAVLAVGWALSGSAAVPAWALPLAAPADLPPMSDYTPLLPWAGWTLLGVAATRAALDRGLDRRLARFRGAGRLGRLLRFGGRHSLPVYLLHQPALMGLVAAAAFVAPPTARIEARFVEDCRVECAAGGRDAGLCASGCACVLDGWARDGLKDRALAGRLDPAEDAASRATVRQCFGAIPAE